MIQKNRKRNYLLILTAGIVLMLLIASCQTSPKTEYIHEVPNVIFPVFPPPDSVTFDDVTGLVSMPLWYWQKIAEYKIDVDGIEIVFNELRKLKNGTDENPEETE